MATIFCPHICYKLFTSLSGYSESLFRSNVCKWFAGSLWIWWCSVCLSVTREWGFLRYGNSQSRKCLEIQTKEMNQQRVRLRTIEKEHGDIKWNLPHRDCLRIWHRGVYSFLSHETDHKCKKQHLVWLFEPSHSGIPPIRNQRCQVIVDIPKFDNFLRFPENIWQKSYRAHVVE
jgi:hypothetical protein